MTGTVQIFAAGRHVRDAESAAYGLGARIAGIPNEAALNGIGHSGIAVVMTDFRDALSTVIRIRQHPHSNRAGVVVVSRSVMGDFLDAGADQVVDSIDFLPHAIRRLRSRMVPVKTVFSFGGLSLDEGRWTMTVTERQADGSTKSATLTEITAVQRAMTKALVEAQGHPVNRQKLLRAARAEGYACPSEKNVDSQITELRRLFAELGVVFPVRAEISVGFCVY